MSWMEFILFPIANNMKYVFLTSNGHVPICLFRQKGGPQGTAASQMDELSLNNNVGE